MGAGFPENGPPCVVGFPDGFHGLTYADMNHEKRTVRCLCQGNGPARGFLLCNGRTGIVVVNRGSFALAEVITGQNGYDVCIFSVDHHGDACLLCIHHGAQYGFVVTVKCSAFVCHKKLQRGHAHFRQMPDFLKYGFLWVHDDCMECKVHR